MSGSRLRDLRQRHGLSQTELAERAGVSRQLVGSLETGRHLPRVDAALGLAKALGVDVADLFGPEPSPREVVTGDPPEEGVLVRFGRVGEQIVFTRAGVEGSGWDSADGVIEHGTMRPLGSPGPGPVMIGCEPGLEVIERNLRERGKGALAVAASSKAALIALQAGRAHVAVVHGAAERVPAPPPDVERFSLCSWRVGLAGPPDARSGWGEAAMSGAVPVAQRESGAEAQAAFERVAGMKVPGPLITGHIDAARMATTAGVAAVTIEPAALALGARFHPLETHHAEMWVARTWLGDQSVQDVLNEIAGDRFQRRLLGVGGYDLAGIGSRAA